MTTPLAFVCHSYHRGGVTRWMIDAALECERRGAPTWFICPEPRAEFIGAGGRPTVLSLLRSATDGSIEICAPSVGWTYELGTAPYRASVYADAIRGGVPAGVPVIVSDDPAAWTAAAWCADRNPMIGVLHADDPPYYELARRYHRSAAAFVGVSRRVVATLSTMIGLSEVEIATIPCGIPLPAPRDAAAGRAPGPARLVWVGRIEERQKRVSDLPRIATALRRRSIPFELTIIGDGPDRGALERQIDEARLRDAVTLLGWQSPAQVHERLQRADVLLLPSNYEGMPIAAMEALATGCGVAGSRVSGLEDYETHPRAASALRLFAVGDYEGAAIHVAALLALSDTERAQAARALAEAEFAIGRSVDRYETTVAAVHARGDGHPRLGNVTIVRRWLGWAASYALATARHARHRLAPPASSAS